MNEIFVDTAVVFGTIGTEETYTADIGDVPIYPAYEGDVKITPNDEQQKLLTAGKYLPADITISRIPNSEYAHITYDQNQNIRVW